MFSISEKKSSPSGAHSRALGKFAAVGDPPGRRFFIEQILGRQERRETAEEKTIELRFHGFKRTLRAMAARGENIIPDGLLCGNPPAHRKLEIPFLDSIAAGRQVGGGLFPVVKPSHATPSAHLRE